MARFCAGCGAALPAHARFCEVCGAPAGPAETAAVAVAAPKKGGPRWILPAALALLAVGLAAAAWLLGELHSPARAREKLLDALTQGDAAALAAIAVREEDRPLDAAAAAPLFRLCAESPSFVEDTAAQLDAQLARLAAGGEAAAAGETPLFRLRGTRAFLHTAYDVVIADCAAELSADLLCTAVLDGGRTVALTASDDGGPDRWTDALGPDCDLARRAGGAAEGLLPGRYTVRAAVTTSFGDRFTAETDLTVAAVSGASAALAFGAGAVTVYNDSRLETSLYVGGTLYGVIAPYKTFLLAPVRPETALEARASSGRDRFSAAFDARAGYCAVAYDLCDAEIHNRYNAPVSVLRGDEKLLEIPAGGTGRVLSLPGGTALTLSLFDGLTEPALLRCEGAHVVWDEPFRLLPAQYIAMDDAVRRYITDCLDAGALEPETLTAPGSPLPATDFSRRLFAVLEEARSRTMEDDGYTVALGYSQNSVERSGEPALSVNAENGLVSAAAEYHVTLGRERQTCYADGTVSDDIGDTVLLCGVTLDYDGAWAVTAASIRESRP